MVDYGIIPQMCELLLSKWGVVVEEALECLTRLMYVNMDYGILLLNNGILPKIKLVLNRV